MKPMSKRLQLALAWHNKFGCDMPDEFAELPTEAIERKLKLLDSTDTVYVLPRTAEPVVVDESSLMDWDSQDDKNANAYGGS